jgi:hypothetical protein
MKLNDTHGVAEAPAPDRVAVLREVWNALDKLYADTDPDNLARRGIGMAARVVADMERAAGVRVPDGSRDAG